MDEYIFSFRRILNEGDKPRLELVIRNPHIGLLNASRKQWAWFARFRDQWRHHAAVLWPAESGAEGHLQGADDDRPGGVAARLQRAAPGLGRRDQGHGPYDPCSSRPAKRDDPDVLLEAVSGLYHIDPVTHVVTISDISTARTATSTSPPTSISTTG
jgi:hypothetical protein